MHGRNTSSLDLQDDFWDAVIPEKLFSCVYANDQRPDEIGGIPPRRIPQEQEQTARARASALMSPGPVHRLARTSTHSRDSRRMGWSPRVFLSIRRSKSSQSVDLLGRDGGFNASNSGDADDADLGEELYTRKKKPSGALSASGSDSRSRTSASFSAGDASRIQNPTTHTTHQSIPYPHTEMHIPAPVRKKPHRASKRTSTSTTPYTPVDSIAETPAVAAFSVPQEGTSIKRRANSRFLAHQG